MLMSIVAATLSLTAAAAAGSHSVSVEVSNRDLATAAGQQNVYASFKKAATKTCLNEYRRSRNFVSLRNCEGDLLEALVEDLNHQGVAAIHYGDAGVRYAETGKQ
jgi:UrcA family protein